ncbi:hypothetical protein ACJEDT_25875 (plasmid) [Rhodococcoides fascians]|uniref:hypothetical protein n=1 Tax=Rhodococcoides fascians TaxID=1828 RepID=UPI00389A9F7A
MVVRSKRTTSKRGVKKQRRLAGAEAVAIRTLLSPLIPARVRAGERASQATLLIPWQSTPSDVQPGSSLHLDDKEFPDEVSDFVGTGALVRYHTLFPAMSAAENLTTVAHLIGRWDATGKLRTASIITLCRSALESASRAVWVLSESDRDERRNRALRITRDEIQRHKKYVTEQVTRLSANEVPAGAGPLPFETTKHLNRLKEQKTGAESAMGILVGADVKGVPTMEQIIDASAEWIDSNKLVKSGRPMANLTRQQYSIASGIAHGSTWPTKYLLGTTDLHSVVADLLYVSLTTTEAAIVLWETQTSVHPHVARKCPQHLRLAARQLHPRYSAPSE